MKILFYDDAYSEDENILFENELLIEVPNIVLKFAHNFYAFEDYISKGSFNIIILDIMGAESDIVSKYSPYNIVRSDLIGIEMLQRIRQGLYPKQNSDVLVIMRTARADEPYINTQCIAEGANFIFPPGSDGDQKIIEIIRQKSSNSKL